jgi:hypothetical protein
VITGRDPFVIRWRCLPLLYVPRRALYVIETTFSSKFESHSLRHSFNHNHLVRGVATNIYGFSLILGIGLGFRGRSGGASDTALRHIGTDLSSPIGQFRLVARAVTGEMAVI